MQIRLIIVAVTIFLGLLSGCAPTAQPPNRYNSDQINRVPPSTTGQQSAGKMVSPLIN